MVLYQKNKFNFEKTFDFNNLAILADELGAESEFASSLVKNNYILESPMKINFIGEHSFFNEIVKFLNIEFNKKNLRNNTSLFFSFTAGGKGLPHKDNEDVTIVGLYGKTIYIIEDKHYIIEKGDMIHIPRGTPHRGIGISPRIIMSFGVYYDNTI
tara:strand:- start:3700 stop:4167 length:468 start_codon:yes stop_codon:yes gene_type:complete